MASFWKITAALLVLASIATAKPLDTLDTNETEMANNENTNEPETLTGEELPQLYLLMADAGDQSDDSSEGNSSPVQKRSAEEVDDLETAAGTNVLRPLFVYRQQLAYRERVKKGAIRRPGIRPRF